MKFHESTYKGQKKLRVVTCPGVAKHTAIKKPDTKFNPEGVFKTGLILSVADAQPLMDRIDEIAKANLEAVKAELVKQGKAAAAKKVALCANMPYSMETDEEGNETGNVVFTFKAPARFKFQDGTTKANKISVVDAKGKASSADVWGGSTISVQAEFRPFPQPGRPVPMMGCGVSLRLEGVQVLELRTGGGTDKTLFDQQEGYSSEDEAADTPAESLHEDSSAADGVDDDL